MNFVSKSASVVTWSEPQPAAAGPGGIPPPPPVPPVGGAPPVPPVPPVVIGVLKSVGSEPGEQDPAPRTRKRNAEANPNPDPLVVRSMTGREMMLRLPEVFMGPPRVGDDTTIFQFSDGRLRKRVSCSARSGNEARRIHLGREHHIGWAAHPHPRKESRRRAAGRDAQRAPQQVDEHLLVGVGAPLQASGD